jgi:polysaccharide chain length determinant protein (PEP-CTERM system associated)
MNSVRSQVISTAQLLWRRKWLCVAVAWLVSTIGWIGVAFVPTRYESTARVYLNADPVLTPLLHGLAADTNPTRHLDFMQRTLLSRPNLEQLSQLTDLDTTAKTPAEKEALFKHLAADVEIRPITPNLLSIGYRDADPVLAKNVVQSLLTIFGEKTAGSSRTEMDSAQRFLDDEIASYTDQLRAAERRRADLSRQYPDIVSNRAPDAPAVGEDTSTRLDRARSAVVRLKGELDDTVTRRDSLRKELASIPPKISVEQAPQVVVNGVRQLSPDEARLADLQKNLDTLRLKYTDQHPDVIATREAIAQVRADMKKPAGGGSGPKGAPKAEIANTVYDQLKVKLVDAEGAVAAAKERLSQAQAEEVRIEKVVKSAPGVLQQAQDLDRDYAVLKKNYQELVARREAAQIANAANTKTEAIQFRIVDPPQVPVLPVAPNRPMLLSVVLLFGIGAGLATPIAVKQFDRSFATIGQLRNLGVPILGSVSRLSLGMDRRRAAIQTAGVCASTLVLIAIYGTLLALSFGLHSVSVS